MALRTSDADDLRTLDLSVPPLTSLLDEKKYPNNKQTSSSDHPVILRTPPARENEHDPNVDKFASLFTPSAPKSSPTLFPVPQQTSSSSQLQKELSTTEDSGSFISVSAYEDPLSSLLPSSNSSLGVPTNFEWDKDDEELLSTPVLFPVQSPPMSVVPTSSQPPSQPTHSDNASLTFFDKFARNAKRNSEIRRKGLVDELLEFADNPLYFLHNEKEAMQKEGQEDGRNTFGNGEQPTSDPELQTSSPPSLSPDDAILHDLDPGYFSSGRLVNINANSDNDKKPSQRWLSDSPHARSPSLPSPATLAPPIINSIIPLDLHNPSNEASTRSDTSFSRSTSSTFSAKWMSNLLKTSSGGGHHQQQEGHGRTPALASIFGVNADASSSSHPPSRTSPPTAASTVSAIYRRNSSSPFRNHPTPHPQPHVSHTLPTPSTSSSLSTVKHTASPFGAHVYIPPSGAPGFKGDSYDWDKGFSNELEKEIVRGRTGGRVNGKGQRVDVDDGRRMLETNTQAHIRADVGVGIGIGALMEKKSGNLDLKGRRASTTPVLSPNLANLLRPHFPALSRLPRSWTLVYSLDQHGISLNTLYMRCEEALSPSPYPSKIEGVGLGTRGVLLVIKDASAAGEEGDEGAFGAWVADGEGLGMGKKGGKGYFGGGESFLWKFTQGTLKVYKTTGKNNYVALCEPGYISFGGGDGHYGLYLDDTLYDGSSAPCPTFDNEPLCSPGPKKAGTATVEFECVGLEVWGMGP